LKPALSGASDIELTVARLGSLIERAISSEYPESSAPSAGSSEADLGADRLVEAMRYTLTTPGKRIRPLLLLACVELLGGDAEAATVFAVAVEQVHAYSLIHDDLPAMDDDDLRRGRPTNHVVFGEGMAILAGDALLTDAFVGMLDAGRSPSIDAQVRMRIAGEVAVAAGREGMVGGQAADLLAEGREPDEAILRSLHGRKTGRLITACVRAGALFAGADAARLDTLTAFAGRFGLAFQIADDIKDVTLPPEITGKAQGGDREAAKMTYPARFGIDESRRLCRRELDSAIEALAPLGGGAALLEHIARDAVSPAFADGG
jgi:geranylgeranyl diphosphate synthase type II